MKINDPIMKIQQTAITQESVNKIQEKEQALYGWIATDAGPITGNFSGIKVLAGATATVTLVFKDGNDTCNVNGISIDLVEGDYLPTPGLSSATVTAGKILLIKDEKF